MRTYSRRFNSRVAQVQLAKKGSGANAPTFPNMGASNTHALTHACVRARVTPKGLDRLLLLPLPTRTPAPKAIPPNTALPQPPRPAERTTPCHRPPSHGRSPALDHAACKSNYCYHPVKFHVSASLAPDSEVCEQTI